MKKLSLLSLLFSSLFLFNSCVVEDDEPKAEALASTPSIVGFNRSIESFNYFADEGPVTRQINVVFEGGGLGFFNSPKRIDFVVDTDESTAQEGREFSFPNGNSFTFDANRDFTDFDIIVNTGSFDASSATYVKLDIVSGNGVLASPDRQSVYVYFVGCISEIQEGTYGWTRVGGDAAGSFAGTTPMTLVAVNEYEMYFPSLSSGGQPLTMNIGDVCGELSILGSELEAFGITVSASSITFDPLTNVIVFYDLQAVGGGYNFQRGTVTYTLN